MFNKTLISEFFTTVSFSQALDSFFSMTFKLYTIRNGKNTEKIENKILKYIGNKNSKIISFYNGRSAIFNALKIINIKNTDEVIASGYTCVSVSNAVIQTGAKLIYSDIDTKTLGFNIQDLKNNITDKTKVIIVQHTFGKPSNIEEIIKLANLKNILIIEDCAHSLGSSINNKQTGSFGDLSIFSTGRDKVISSVTGGFLIINNEKYFSKIEEVKNKLNMPSLTLTIRNLMYNLVAYKAFKLYDFWKFGKITIFLSRKFNLITEILTKKEKECNFNEFYYKLPNSLSYLGIKQLNKIDYFSNHRNNLAKYYQENINNINIKTIFNEIKGEYNNFYRFPILLDSEKIKDDFYDYMKSHNILLGNYWSGQEIIPIGTNLGKAGYKSGCCENAKDISKRILTLPNHINITISDTKKITEILNNFKK